MYVRDSKEASEVVQNRLLALLEANDKRRQRNVTDIVRPDYDVYYLFELLRDCTVDTPMLLEEFLLAKEKNELLPYTALFLSAYQARFFLRNRKLEHTILVLKALDYRARPLIDIDKTLNIINLSFTKHSKPL